MSKPWLEFYDAEVPDRLEIPPIIIPDLLTNAARKHPNHTATVFLGARLTYSRLKQQVDKLAAALHRLGISKGDRVAIMMPNCQPAVIAYYATLSLGAGTVMTKPLYVERELEHQWGDSGGEVVISFDLFWPQIDAVKQKLPIKHVILGGIQDYMPLVKKTLTPFELRRRGKWVKVTYNDTVHSFKKLINGKHGPPPQVEINPEDLACLQ